MAAAVKDGVAGIGTRINWLAVVVNFD